METVNSFDILIALIKGCQQNGDDQHIDGPENHDAKIGNLKYLLGQIVRSLWNRKGHKGLSKEAARIWDGLKVGEDIFDYYYQRKVFYKNDVPVHVKGYIGAKSNPDWEEDLKFTKEGDYFRFRQVFHIEHIVPISVILEQLISLDLSEDLDVVTDRTIIGKSSKACIRMRGSRLSSGFDQRHICDLRILLIACRRPRVVISIIDLMELFRTC